MSSADLAILAVSLGVLGAYVLLSLLRGTLKLILISASTASGAFCAWAALHQLPAHFGNWLKAWPDWVLPVLTTAAGLFGFLIVKSLLFIIFRPISFGADEKKAAQGFSLFRSLIGLACGVALAWGAGVLLRYGGQLASLRLADQEGGSGGTHALLWKIQSWHQAFESSTIGRWHHSTDPLAGKARAESAELAIRLGKLEDVPENFKLRIEDEVWQTFQAKIQDARIQSLIEKGDYSSLLEEAPPLPGLDKSELQELIETLKHPDRPSTDQTS